MEKIHWKKNGMMNCDILEEQKKAWGLTRRFFGGLPHSSQVGIFLDLNQGVPKKHKYQNLRSQQNQRQITVLISS